MTDVAEVLNRYGLDASESDVAAVLNSEFQTMPVPAAAVPSAGTVEYLAEHGGRSAAAAVDSWSATQEQHRRSRAAFTDVARLVGGTLSVDQVAQQIGLNPSRVRHLITDQPRRLYAIKVGHRRRVPAWQIHQGELLPGLHAVAQAIPESAHPLDVAGVMTTPQDELSGRTPVEHLAGGGDPDPVAQLITELERW